MLAFKLSQCISVTSVVALLGGLLCATPGLAQSRQTPGLEKQWPDEVNQGNAATFYRSKMSKLNGIDIRGLPPAAVDRAYREVEESLLNEFEASRFKTYSNIRFEIRSEAEIIRQRDGKKSTVHVTSPVPGDRTELHGTKQDWFEWSVKDALPGAAENWQFVESQFEPVPHGKAGARKHLAGTEILGDGRFRVKVTPTKEKIKLDKDKPWWFIYTKSIYGLNPDKAARLARSDRETLVRLAKRFHQLTSEADEAWIAADHVFRLVNGQWEQFSGPGLTESYKFKLATRTGEYVEIHDLSRPVQIRIRESSYEAKTTNATEWRQGQFGGWIVRSKTSEPNSLSVSGSR